MYITTSTVYYCILLNMKLHIIVVQCVNKMKQIVWNNVLLSAEKQYNKMLVYVSAYTTISMLVYFTGETSFLRDIYSPKLSPVKTN